VNRSRIREILQDIAEGRLTVEEAITRFSTLPYEDISFARVDHHRELRVGFPEVILGEGKTTEQVVEIARSLLRHESNLLVTRTNETVYQHVVQIAPDAQFHRDARIISVIRDLTNRGDGTIAVVSAGTSDIPVAEEAAVTAEAMGNQVSRLYDVGVAGIHRLFDAMESCQNARVVIVVAGMEGALPSVVGGLVAAPVIAVPTSVGYGASFGGVAALLGMLNSCAANVAAVNIDNGFGAGVVASLINRRHE
jgi:NCAIR mutase (PurE)-related protein